MFVVDYDRVIAFGEVEYAIFLKLLKNDELTDEEERRADQMYRTAVKAKKVKASRDRMSRQRTRPDGKVSPRHPRSNEYVGEDSEIGIIPAR